MLFIKKHITLVLLSLIIISLFSCGEDEFTEITITQSQQEMYAQIINYVTKGVIHPEGEIRINFVSPVVELDDVGLKLSQIPLTFKPAINGQAEWETINTLVFKPENNFPLNTNYQVKVKLNMISESFKDIDDYPFSFKTDPRRVSGFRYEIVPVSDKDLNQIKYVAQFNLNYPLNIEKIRENIKLKIDEKEIPFSLDFKDDLYTVSSQNIKKVSNKQFVILELNHNNLDMEQEFVQRSSISRESVFEIKNIYQEEQYILIEFNQQLKENQDIRGFIKVNPQVSFSSVIQGQYIKLSGPFDPTTRYAIEVQKGIESNWGTKTNETKKEEIQLQDINPDIEFIHDGIFLTSKGNRKVFFKSVNVKAVNVTVTKVYVNNLLQFLQTAQVSSNKTRRDLSTNLNTVGIEVANQKIELDLKKNVNRIHEIDLQKLIENKDKGLYILKIYFSREDMNYILDDSTSYRYYGDDYYSNPNSRGYLRRHGTIVKPVIVTDIGLKWKAGIGQHYIYTADLITSNPLVNAVITLYTYQQQVVATGKTNNEGFYSYNQKESDLPVAFVTAEYNGQISFLSNREMGWNISSFETGGMSPDQYGLRCFIFSDRGIYRPGDNVYLSSIFRNSNNTFPPNHPVTLKVYNPQNKLTYEETLTKAEDGFYCYTIPTKPNDLTGYWKVNLLAGNSVFSKKIRIETIVPERIKVELSADKKELLPGQNRIKIDISSLYLFGAPAKDLRVSASAKITSAEPNFKKFQDYIFSNPAVQFSEINKTFNKQRLSEQGKAAVSWDLPKFISAPAKLNAGFTISVEEKGGRQVNRQLNIPIYPYKNVVGIEKPDYRKRYMLVHTDVSYNVVCLDYKGQPVKGRKLTYKLYHNRYYWWWHWSYRYDDMKNFRSYEYTKLIETNTITSKDQPVAIKIRPEERGTYLLEIIDSGGHSCGTFFRASGWGQEATVEEGGNILMLHADKQIYNPGNTAQIGFPVGQKGTVLLSVEKSGEVIKIENFKAIPDEFSEMTYKLPITTDMAPNVYVVVSYIQPHSQSENDRPIRMFGILNLSVEDPTTKQDLELKIKDTLRPGEDFSISCHIGKNTQCSVAVVDEGLLGITGFKTPNAWDYFYAKEKLSVITRDLYDQVIGLFRGDIFKTFSIGGGGGGPMEDEYSRQQAASSAQDPDKMRFKPVVMFKGPIMADSNGNVNVDFTMPNYMGEVRVMLLTAKKNRYGMAEKQVPVKSELIVQPTLPRFLTPLDEFTMPVNIFVLEKGINNVNVEVNVSGPVEVTDKASYKINVKNKQEATITFSLKAKKEIGKALVKVSAKSGSFSSFQETYIDVLPASPRISKSISKTLEIGRTIEMTIPDDGIKGSNIASISISRLSVLDFGKRMDWLIRYPHGCLEQTMSSLFPQLYYRNFISDKDKLKDLDYYVNEGIMKLYSFQGANGSFGYWSANDYNSWTTNYVGHFLLDAKRMGYHVPNDMLASWINFQQSKATDTNTSFRDRAYRVFLLSLAGKPSYGGMNLLKQNYLNKMSVEAKWLLAGAYYLAGQKQTAENIVSNIGVYVEDYIETGKTYGSSLRDTAIILNTATLMQKNDICYLLYNDIVETLNSKDWYNTQALGFSLMAVGRFMEYIEKREQDTAYLEGTISLPQKGNIPIKTTQPMIAFDIQEGFGQKIKISIKSIPKSQVAYCTINWSGIPVTYEGPAIQSRMTLDINFLDENGASINPEKMEQGTEFWVLLYPKHSYRHYIEEIALTLIVPAGWEIENPRLTGDNFPNWFNKGRLLRYEYLDVRDDRVHWYFDLYDYDQPFTAIKVRAITPGAFNFAPAIVEAMYNNKYSATTTGRKVQVLPRGTQ